MTDNLTTISQKIRRDLTARLRQAEQKEPATTQEAIENGWLIGWLQRKIAFFESGMHRERDRANSAAKFPPVQFEREPDEHLLDASDDTLSGSLKDAGFDSFGPM